MGQTIRTLYLEGILNEDRTFLAKARSFGYNIIPFGLPAVPAILASASAQPLYAAFCDLPPPPGGWELLLSPAVVPDAAFR